MPDTASIVIVKAFTYRDAYEEFSNRYHLTQAALPPDKAGWTQVATDFINAERPTVPSSVSFVRAYAYKPGVEHSIEQIDFATPGPAPVGSLAGLPATHYMPGDVAATIRWDTGEVNSRGKRIYCRKYMHGVYRSVDDADELHATQLQAMQTFAGVIIAKGFNYATGYCGPQGATLKTPIVDKYLTTRTLKRRGKRPLP